MSGKYGLVLRAIFASIAVISSASLVVLSSANAEGTYSARSYQIAPHDVPGWKVTAIRVGRRESNWRAWHDSRPDSRYFYRGAWAPLRRTTGWFERLAVSRRNAEAQVIVLISAFPTVADAKLAYQTILPHTSMLVRLPLRAHTVQWQTNAGVASGPHGLAGYFGGFTTFMQTRTTLVEIRADVGGRQGTVLVPPLPNPGRAIAQHLARAIKAGSPGAEAPPITTIVPVATPPPAGVYPPGSRSSPATVTPPPTPTAGLPAPSNPAATPTPTRP